MKKLLLLLLGLPLISVDQLVKSMDDRGIDKSVIMSTSIENNDECKEIIKKYPHTS